MSLYGAEFIRTLKQRFGPDADVNFTPHGYLVLASTEGAEQLIDNSKPEKLNKNQTDENINIKEKTKIGDECTIDTNNAESVINADEKTSSDKTIGDSISEPDTSDNLEPIIVSVGERIKNRKYYHSQKSKSKVALRL